MPTLIPGFCALPTPVTSHELPLMLQHLRSLGISAYATDEVTPRIAVHPSDQSKALVLLQAFQCPKP